MLLVMDIIVVNKQANQAGGFSLAWLDTWSLEA
jgi:hypothetical protein